MLPVSALYNAWYLYPTVYIDEAISEFGFKALFWRVPTILFW